MAEEYSGEIAVELENNTRQLNVEETRMLLLYYNIRRTATQLISPDDAEDGPPIADLRDGRVLFDEKVVVDWAKGQDTGFEFYENHLDEIAFKKPLWALVCQYGPEANYLGEQLKEFGCDVIRLNPATALEYAESCFDAALFVLEPDQLALMIPAVAIFTDRNVPCVVVKNDVGSFPEFPEAQVLAIDTIEPFYDRIQERSDVLGERMRLNRRRPLPLIPEVAYLVFPRGRS